MHVDRGLFLENIEMIWVGACEEGGCKLGPWLQIGTVAETT